MRVNVFRMHLAEQRTQNNASIFGYLRSQRVDWLYKILKELACHRTWMREKVLVASDATLDGVACLELLLPVGTLEVFDCLAQLLLWVLQRHIMHLVLVAFLQPICVRGHAS